MNRDKMIERLEALHPGITSKLGTMPDPQIGKIYNLTRSRIHQIRKYLQIPHTVRVNDNPELISKLGTMRDKDLGALVGRTAHQIRTLRLKHKIKPYSDAQERDEKIASRIADLGKISDRKLAMELNLTATKIYNYRKRHNIETSIISPRHKLFVKAQPEKLKQLFNEGKSDKEIAEDLGISKSYVLNLRRTLGMYRTKPHLKGVPKYPYDTWLDGNLHTLIRDKDFSCTVNSLRWRLRQLATKAGKKVVVRATKNGMSVKAAPL